MFSFRETYFRLVGLFDWGYARTQFLLSVSRNRYGFTLARYRNEKYATDPALILRVFDHLEMCTSCSMIEVSTVKYNFSNFSSKGIWVSFSIVFTFKFCFYSINNKVYIQISGQIFYPYKNTCER